MLDPWARYTESEPLVRNFFDNPVCRGIGIQAAAGTVYQATPFLDLAAVLPYPVLSSTIFSVTALTTDFEGTLEYEDYMGIIRFGSMPLGLSAFPIAEQAPPVMKTVTYLRMRGRSVSRLQASLSFHEFMDLHDRACRQCLAELMQWCPPMGLAAAAWMLPSCRNMLMNGAPDALTEWVAMGYVHGDPGIRWWRHIFETGARRVVAGIPWCPNLAARIVRRFESLDLSNHGFTLVIILPMATARRAARLVEGPLYVSLRCDGRDRHQMAAVVAPGHQTNVIIPAEWFRFPEREDERERREP